MKKNGHVMGFEKYRHAVVAIASASAFTLGALSAINGCTGEPFPIVIRCVEDAGPDAERGMYCGDGAMPQGEPLSCKAQGGDCVELGTANFTHSAFLLWIGAEEEQPARCPERASSEYYEGYGDLVVAVECQTCSCGPATCILPNAMNADPDSFCQGANAVSYAAPAEWDGSCVSPSILPPGSFSSIELNPATVSPCEPIGEPVPKVPGFAPGPSSFSNGVYWGNFAKGCQGAALSGDCENTGDLCLPTSEPPPPGFRQCVQYTLPVDENKKPACPAAFPEQFVFYSGWEGKAECSACECGDPVGGQCSASFSAYQDTACLGQGMPLFTGLPSGLGLCVDFMGVPYSLGSMEAKWGVNKAGTCQPSGGEVIGEVKGVEPSLFCCQEPPKPSSK